MITLKQNFLMYLICKIHNFTSFFLVCLKLFYLFNLRLEPLKIEWPEQFTYYLNEELANINRVFFKSKENSVIESQTDSFTKLFKIIKCCVILSQ